MPGCRVALTAHSAALSTEAALRSAGCASCHVLFESVQNEAVQVGNSGPFGKVTKVRPRRRDWLANAPSQQQGRAQATAGPRWFEDSVHRAPKGPAGQDLGELPGQQKDIGSMQAVLFGTNPAQLSRKYLH
jgi:hypothetical protein